ncbi:hypothetical protein [Actinomycetospora soli]|uniref:hypothetical protein n=1 Tax=Actinomycetospora soli TaxID=2893887 RepID=UPI001E5C5855|nr:hypothetical protein [Actinomycetospora soli]MCD2190282.1 hypothetical protein [Actinomycetospora soli]
MSRPEQPGDEPRLPRDRRTVHRRSAPVPIRVVSQRLPADATVGPPAAPVPTAVAGVPATGAVAALQQAPLPSPEVVGLPVRADRAPVLDGRRPLSRLLALVRSRRRVGAGRHRPDTIPSRGWSMFAPPRRSRRRFGVRR